MICLFEFDVNDEFVFFSDFEIILKCCKFSLYLLWTKLRLLGSIDRLKASSQVSLALRDIQFNYPLITI